MSVESFSFWFFASRSDAKRDRGLKTPEDIRRIDRIPYGPDARWNTLDVYRPRGKAGKLPVIVNIHGGGYVYGSTKQYQFYCMGLAQRGFAVVSFNYHLAPKYKFPTPVRDTNLVMEWICRKAEIYGFDTDNVVIVGDSAGAQLASQYAVICTDPDYAKIMEITPPEFTLRAVGLNCGMYDLKKRAGEIPGNKLMIDYFTKDPSVYGKKLDVLSHVTEKFPPAYLLSAKGDFLVEQCRPMAELLRSKGVPCEYRIYGDEKTGHVFHLDMRSDLARKANDEEIAFIREHLHGC
ncbi:MAG TPA: alpha/beta hydrolase [Candidatus Mediterraneibacter guildfordensis]|nr:alpha/beta hydrolase [Candidatus Mediterraneibacter guildfordensis]